MLLTDDDRVVAQGLADVATIAVLQHRAVRHAQEVVAELQEALNSRVAIEQAKGVLAERASVDMDQAFDRLRRFARSHNQRLSAVAASLVNRSMPETDLAALLDGAEAGA
jgi:AmiR/NasT family two-component response regulator